jgi:hypothetical protein
VVSEGDPAPSFVPNCDRAEVALNKVTQYILNPAHPDGAPKAAFFMAFGFRPSEADALAAALLAHVQENPVGEITVVAFGVIYGVDAPLICPDGRAPMVRSVWIIEPPADHPRLVTAYPAPGRKAP